MSTPSEYEDLDSLIGNAGWLRLKQWVENDFAAKMQHAMEQAANSTDDIDALNKLRQVLAAKKAVMLVLDWPQQRLNGLRAQKMAQETHTDLSRSGYR